MGNTPGLIGKIPTPNSWKSQLDTLVKSSGVLALLEKQVGQTTVEDIAGALDEYLRLFKAGIASGAEILTLSRAFPNNEEFTQAASRLENTPVVVGGPASVEMIDREGHLITTNALTKAFDKYMANFRTRNAMVLHSDVQVGWALPAYISAGGQIFKSGVNDQGMFFITEVRDDTRIAKRVVEQINEGKLRSYSIAGSAVKTQNMQKGLMPYMQVDELELAEVTVCEKGVNQGANFDLLKGMLADGAGDTCVDGSCLINKTHNHLDELNELIGTQTGKLGKEQVQYRDASEAEKNAGIMCGTCKYFNAGMSTCDLVNGNILPSDWCSVFYPIDDSPVLENENNVREIMVLSEDGKVDYAKSFNNWVQKLSYTVDMGDISPNRATDLDLKFPGWRRHPEEYKEEIDKLTTSQNKIEEIKKAVMKKSILDVFKANGNGNGSGDAGGEESPRPAKPTNGAKNTAAKPFHDEEPSQTDPQAQDPDDAQREQWKREDKYRSKALELFMKSEAMHTIENQGGREAEHHHLLREYGFPSEIPPEAARYVPVVETETNDWGIPLHVKPPWVVNEAGQELGISHVEEASHNLAKVFMAWMKKQRIPTTADPARTDMSRRQPQRSQGPKRRLNYGRIGQR